MDEKFSEVNQATFPEQVKSLLQQNLLPQALSIAEERLMQFPLDVDAYAVAGDVLVRMGRIADARDNLRKIEEIISSLSLVYERMGDIFLKNGLLRDASTYYRKYIVLNPTADHAQDVAKKLIPLEQEEAPRTEIEEPGEIDLPSPDFYTVTLADLYIKQGHLKMAADVLQDIIRKEPANIQARAKYDTVKAAISLKLAADRKTTNTGDLINVLSIWLENVGRIKDHAT